VSFNFDQSIDRNGSGALKYDGRQTMFGTEDVQPLWVADMDFAAPLAVTQALQARAAHPVYGYTLVPESVTESLIAWMQHRHGWRVEREWVLLVPGVVSSLNASVMAFTALGDGVIVQPPVYFPFYSAVTKSGRTLVRNPLQLVNGRYEIDFEHLEHCAAQSRLLMLCSPHNPVGRVWKEEELRRILDIAQRHDLTILADEIHADLIYRDHHHRPLATLSDSLERIVTAVAPSKTFNIPGLGLSALIIPDADRRAAISKVFDSLHMTASNPFSLVAFEAAYRHGEPWLESLLDYLQATRDQVSDFAAQHLSPIRLIPAEGTYLLWLDCRALHMTDAQLERFFIEEAGLGLSPGRAFGPEGSGFMRLNIGAPRAAILSGLERLAAAISRITP